MSMSQLFDHRPGALGGGNDIEKGHHTIEEACHRALACDSSPRSSLACSRRAWRSALRANAMPCGCFRIGAHGFTYQGAPHQQGKLLCYFKSSAAGNQDGESAFFPLVGLLRVSPADGLTPWAPRRHVADLPAAHAA